MKTISTIILAISCVGSTALAQNWQAWKWEAPVEVRETGMMRLEVPPAVLDVSRPDLGDLRLLSPSGVETGYLVELPRRRDLGVRVAAGFKVTLLDQNTVVEIKPEPAEAIDAIELVSPAREFLKAVNIEGRSGSGEWQKLATNEVIFRQASGAERLRVPLPAGVWENLRLTVNDTRSLPVPFTAVNLSVSAEKPVTAERPVVLGVREELPGETQLTLDLGARNLNVAELRFEISDAVFSRTCSLAFSTSTSDGESRMESLGGGILYRVSGDREASVEHLVIPVHRRIPSRYLVATFRNGDSQALSIVGAGVRYYPTTLAFYASQAGVHRLLTGNPKVLSPEYDLASLRGAIGSALGPLLVPGSVKAKSDFIKPPALPGVESAGADIELANWTRRRKVDFSLTGVIQIELDAWVLAGSQQGLGDLRLIQNGRQIPYLIKPALVVRELSPAMRQLPQDAKQPTVSQWEITLPVDGLPALDLTATSPAALFARRFEASAGRKDELGNSWIENLGTADWSKVQGRETPLSLFLGGQRIPRTIQLKTDHGDNPPISVENPRVRYKAPVIVAKVTEDAPLFLVYGNPKASAPQYDLRLVQKELMAAESQSLRLEAEELLGPGKRETLAVNAGSPWLWLALGGVVIALLAVVAKLLPRAAAGPQ